MRIIFSSFFLPYHQKFFEGYKTATVQQEKVGSRASIKNSADEVETPDW